MAIKLQAGKVVLKNGNASCSCCGSIITIPCRDCPPYDGNFTFSLSGDQVEITSEFQYPPDIRYDPPRICEDYYDAFGPGTFGQNLYLISIRRSASGFGAPPGTPCCWLLNLYVQGTFFVTQEEYSDVCFVNAGATEIITNLNPAGSYNLVIYESCFPPHLGLPPYPFNFTVTLT